MATQQVRNIINSQIDSLLVRAESEVKNQGKKKLEKYKNKLMTPDTIAKSLNIPTNENTCSDAGHEKYNRIKGEMIDKLTNIGNTINNAREKLQNLDDKISPIVNGEGPIGKIKKLRDDIVNPVILPTLKGLTLAIPVALFAIPTPPPGVPGLGGLIPKLSDKLRLVNSKTKEIISLIESLGGIFDFYEKYAGRIREPLLKVLGKLNFISEMITKLLAFIHSFDLAHVSACDELENASDVSVNSDTMTGDSSEDSTENNSVIPDPLGPTPLDQYLALLESQYNEVYLQVLTSNNKKYIERVFAIKQNLEEDYNISFKTINP